MEQKMKSVISAQRMLITELMKEKKSKIMINYWTDEVRGRSIDLENYMIKERQKERKEIKEIFGIDL